MQDFTLPTLNYSTGPVPPSQNARHQGRHSPNQSQRRTPPSASPSQTNTTPTPQGRRPSGYTVSKATAKASILDDPAIAIDFVLALEQPCLPHIPHPSHFYAHTDNNNNITSPPLTTDLDHLPDADTSTELEPSNHMQMLSAPLVQFAPTSPEINSSWQASASIIKELLNLSKSINLEGEITPVECWWRLRGHPGFQGMGKREMEALKRELQGGVRCCG